MLVLPLIAEAKYLDVVLGLDVQGCHQLVSLGVHPDRGIAGDNVTRQRTAFYSEVNERKMVLNHLD